jgi:tetratricopeptide (TPR) repeat protein
MWKPLWLKKLSAKMGREFIKAKCRLIKYYWISRIQADPNVKVPEIRMEDTVDFYANDGLMYLDFEEYEKASRKFLKVIEMKPEFFYGYRLLGVAYDAMGRTEEAKKNYEKGLELALKSKAAGETDYPFLDDVIETTREDLAELAAWEEGEGCRSSITDVQR